MPKLRRTQTIYITLDPFLSPRGKVLHHFEQFIEGVEEADFPCVWLTGLTRAQLDEPRRRLGNGHPFIGESGCGVYLPEDYFHLKSGKTIRLGRFTCMPAAKPQPAAAEALEELSADLAIPVVPLRSLSPRELSQNTGLPASEAEHIRMRDFDELFFFAGATDEDIERFRQEAILRGWALQKVGAFWSLSCGADLAKCIRELGELYDRAVRSHVLRVAVAVTGAADAASAAAQDGNLRQLFRECDRKILLTERAAMDPEDEEEPDNPSPESSEDNPSHAAISQRQTQAQATIHLHAPDVWEQVLAAILERP